jgi:hypothetical protein
LLVCGDGMPVKFVDMETCLGSMDWDVSWAASFSFLCLRWREMKKARRRIRRMPATPMPAPMPALAPVEREEEWDDATSSLQGRPRAKTLRFVSGGVGKGKIT